MKCFASKLCCFPIGLFALIALASLTLPVIPTQANDDSDAPAAVEEAETGEKASKDSDDTKKAKKEEAEKDPFEVPDGSAKELFEYIEALHKLRPPQGEKEFEAFVEKAITASMAACDKILEGKNTEEEAAQAIEEKFDMYEGAEHFELETILATKKAFLESLKKDKRPAVVKLVAEMLFKQKANELHEMDEQAKKAFLAELVAKIKADGIDEDDVEMLEELASRIEYSDHPEGAGAIYAAAQPVLLGSESEDVVEYAKGLDGTIRRLQLVGNTMKLEGKLLDGKKFDWKSYRGKVVLVDFWATWCGPCVSEIPNMKDAYKKYHDKGFEIVGVNLDDDAEEVEDFVDEKKIPWANLRSADDDKTGWEHPMATYYGIKGIPTMMLVGKDGKVVTLSARGEDLQKALKKLLGEPLKVKKAEDKDSEEDKEENEKGEDE